MAISPAADGLFIRSTTEMLAAVVERLEAVDDMDTYPTKTKVDWSVTLFPGTSYKQLFDLLPMVELPAAIVIYGGSFHGDDPRRDSRVNVLVACETFDTDTDLPIVHAMVDQVRLLTDRQICGNGITRQGKDTPVDLEYDSGATLAAVLVTLEIQDR